MAHTHQERYSRLVDAKLRATLVKKDGVIFNNRYEGNPKAGVVKIPGNRTVCQEGKCFLRSDGRHGVIDAVGAKTVGRFI